MKKVFIVGMSSFIGSSLAVYLRKHYRVYGTYSTYKPQIDNVISFKLTLKPTDHIDELIRFISPDVVIYCAAMNNENECINQPALALYVNGEAPQLFARAIENIGGRFIFLSTSKVFSGEKGSYTESDPPRPQSTYGRTKYRAEESIKGRDNTFILRLGTAFGLASYGQRSFLNRMLYALWRKEELNLISNEHRSFFSVEELAKAVGVIIDVDIGYSGIYHIGGDTKDTYYSFMSKVASIFHIPHSLLKPVEGDFYNDSSTFQGKRRGQDLSLCHKHFSDTFHHQFLDPEHSIERLCDQLKNGKI